MKRILTVVFATTLGLACAKGDTDKRCRNLARLHHLGGLRAEAQALAKPGEKVPGDTTLRDSLAESPSLMNWYETHCK